MPAEVKKKIKDFFLSYGTGPDAAREKAIMLKLTTAGFKSSNDLQLIPIRQLELFKDKTKIENDVNMNAEEKKLKIEAIDRKLSVLAAQK